MNKPLTEQELNNMSKEELIASIMTLQSNSIDLNMKVELLREQVRYLQNKKYGRKTETASSLFEQQQLDLWFNEVESISNPLVSEPKAENVVSKHKKRTPGQKKEMLSKIEDHKDIELEISRAELIAKYGEDGWKELPSEEITKLEYSPAKYTVVTYHVHVYVGKDDSTYGIGLDEKYNNERIVRAPKPAELLQKSILTPSLLASIVNAKYINAVPLARQERDLNNNDIEINRVNMANWCIKGANVVKPLYEKIKSLLLEEHIIHADETPFLISKDGRPAGSESRMWVYTSGEITPIHPIVIYDSQLTRETSHPEEFLDGFNGVAVTDGYESYHKIDREKPNIKVAGCYAHAKRKFADVIKDKKNAKNTIAYIGAEKISKLIHKDNKLKNLEPEERLKKRQELIKPIVDELFIWAKEKQPQVDSESGTGKALNYLINQEKYLRVFLEDPLVPTTNNTAERAIRPFTLGRKNWVAIDTVKGAEASAILYSFAETAKANKLRPYEYFKYIFEEMPKYQNTDIPELLLPWSQELPEYIKSNKK